MAKKVVAIVGSYRKGGVIDTAIDQVLAGAKAQGAETEKIYLIDEKLMFCTNCRACNQTPGTARGKCVLDDGLEAILAKLDQADALVLGSPVNYYNITAISRQFLERLVGSAYWPWGKAVAPKPRNKTMTKPAVLITSAAMPGFLHGLATGAPKALKLMAGCLGAKPVKTLSFGMLNMKPDTNLSKRQAAKARAAAQDLLNAQI